MVSDIRIKPFRATMTSYTNLRDKVNHSFNNKVFDYKPNELNIIRLKTKTKVNIRTNSSSRIIKNITWFRFNMGN